MEGGNLRQATVGPKVNKYPVSSFFSHNVFPITYPPKVRLSQTVDQISYIYPVAPSGPLLSYPAKKPSPPPAAPQSSEDPVMLELTRMALLAKYDLPHFVRRVRTTALVDLYCFDKPKVKEPLKVHPFVYSEQNVPVPGACFIRGRFISLDEISKQEAILAATAATVANAPTLPSHPVSKNRKTNRRPQIVVQEFPLPDVNPPRPSGVHRRPGHIPGDRAVKRMKQLAVFGIVYENGERLNLATTDGIRRAAKILMDRLRGYIAQFQLVPDPMIIIDQMTKYMNAFPHRLYLADLSACLGNCLAAHAATVSKIGSVHRQRSLDYLKNAGQERWYVPLTRQDPARYEGLFDSLSIRDLALVGTLVGVQACNFYASHSLIGVGIPISVYTAYQVYLKSLGKPSTVDSIISYFKGVRNDLLKSLATSFGISSAVYAALFGFINVIAVVVVIWLLKKLYYSLSFDLQVFVLCAVFGVTIRMEVFQKIRDWFMDASPVPGSPDPVPAVAPAPPAPATVVEDMPHFQSGGLLSFSDIADLIVDFTTEKKHGAGALIFESIPRVANLGRALDWLLTNGRRLYAYMYSKVTGNPLPVTPHEVLLLALADRINGFKASCLAVGGYATAFLNSKDTRTVATVLIDEHRSALRDLAFAPPTRVSPIVSIHITSLSAVVAQFETALRTLEAQVPLRPLPVWVHLYGNPGIGKTEAYKTLILSVYTEMQKRLPDSPVWKEPFDSNRVYNMVQSDAYWDGYNRQPIMTCDEIFAINDSTIKGATAMTVLTLMSSAPCSVLAADPSLKGKVFLMPQLFLTSGNAPSFTSLGVSEETAVNDRVTFFLQTRKDEDKLVFSTSFDGGKMSKVPLLHVDGAPCHSFGMDLLVRMICDRIVLNNEYITRPTAAVAPSTKEYSYLHPRASMASGPDGPRMQGDEDPLNPFEPTSGAAPQYPPTIAMPNPILSAELSTAVIKQSLRPDMEAYQSRFVFRMNQFIAALKWRHLWPDKIASAGFVRVLEDAPTAIADESISSDLRQSIVLYQHGITPPAKKEPSLVSRLWMKVGGKSPPSTKNVLLCLAGLAACTAVVVASVKLIYSMSSMALGHKGDPDDVEPQSGDFKGGASKRRVVRAPPKDPVTQAGFQPDSGLPVKIRRNLVPFAIGTARAYLLGLGGQLFAGNAHMFTSIPHDAILMLGWDGQSTSQRFSKKQIHIFPAERAPGVVFVYLEGASFRARVDHFLNDVDYDLLPVHRMSVAASFDGSVIYDHDSSPSLSLLPAPILDCTYSVSGMLGRQGMCGSPYFLSATRTGDILLGIHGAGHEVETTSYFSRIYLSDFKAASELAVHAGCNMTGVQELPFTKGLADPATVQSGRLLHVPGTVPIGTGNLRFYIPSDQTIKKSIFHPEHPFHDSYPEYDLGFEPTRIPSELRPHDGVIPFNYVMAKHFEIKDQIVSPGPFPDSLHSLPAVWHELLPPSFSPSIAAKKLTLDEAIRGGDYVKSLDLSTSPGYPYAALGISRADALFKGNQYNPEFLASYHELKKILATDVAYSRSLTFLKNELLPAEDVAKGKVRRICAGELTHYVMCREYCYHFLEQITASPATTPISIGLDPHSLQWTILFDRLTRKGFLATAGDFSGMEFTIHTIYIDKFVQFVQFAAPMEEPDRTIRSNLIRSVINSIHCVEDFLFWCEINGSGHYFTAFFTSFVNYALHYCAYIDLGHTSVSWLEEVEKAFTGDDSVVVPADLSYNMPYLAKYASSTGMFYTTSSKKETEDEFEHILRVEYLKRKFKHTKELRRYLVAPLRYSSIMESVMYVNTKSKDPAHDLYMATTSVLIELRHYDQETYDKFLQIFRAWARATRPNSVYDDWPTAMAKFFVQKSLRG